MKINLQRKINFTEVDSEFVMTLHSLVKLLQDAAIKHSNQAEMGSKQLIENGSVWILHQTGIEIEQWPVYEENIDVITWHRGVEGIKAYREFEIYSDSRKIATASGVYLYYDIKKRKIRRIPKDVSSLYSCEHESAFQEHLGTWKPVARFDHIFDVSITLRLSDFDPMGHVNNSVYFDFIETMLLRYLNREIKIKKIKIQYAREINKSVKTIKAGLAESQTGYKFKIFNENTIFSFGEIETNFSP